MPTPESPSSIDPLPESGAHDIVLSAREAYARTVAEEREFRDCVVRPHERKLFAFAYARLKNYADAEDVVQKVLVGAAKHQVIAKCGGDDERIESYLVVAVDHEVGNELRRRKRERRLLDAIAAYLRTTRRHAEPADHHTYSREIMRHVHGALEEVDPLGAEAFRLVQLCGIRYSVAAEVLQVNVNTLRAMLVRTQRHLRERLTAIGYGPAAIDVGEQEETP
jgi:RNA polymerase sigma factor (sigma-70 family)